MSYEPRDAWTKNVFRVISFIEIEHVDHKTKTRFRMNDGNAQNRNEISLGNFVRVSMLTTSYCTVYETGTTPLRTRLGNR